VVGAYYRFLERRQFKNSDAVVVITNSFSSLAKRWTGSDGNVFVIENWGALDDITPHPKDNEWARRHGLQNSFNFLYSGTLGLKHNPELLVQLAKAVKGRANVVTVSQGVGVSHLQRAKTEQGLDNLIVLPLQPFAELPFVLATSDVAVATIEPEAGMFSVPSKVQSYFCAGRPVLLAAPRENLASDVVRKNGAGLVIDPLDQEGFLQAALRLLDDHKLRFDAGAKARSFALNHYDIKKVTDRFETVFDYAIGTKSTERTI